MIFEWIAAYNVNIKSMDTQHRKLVDILNRLDNCIKEGGSVKQELTGLLDELMLYTKYHFSTEDVLIKRPDC